MFFMHLLNSGLIIAVGLFLVNKKTEFKNTPFNQSQMDGAHRTSFEVSALPPGPISSSRINFETSLFVYLCPWLSQLTLFLLLYKHSPLILRCRPAYFQSRKKYMKTLFQHVDCLWNAICLFSSLDVFFKHFEMQHCMVQHCISVV